MKIRFLINTLFLSLVLCTNLLASKIPADYKQIDCTFRPIVAKLDHQSHHHIAGPKAVIQPKIQATSTNWAGYVAASYLNGPNNSVSAAYGSWIVPSVKPCKNNTHSRIWVGVGGFFSPDPDVVHIGTSHNFINGSGQHYAWFEVSPGGSYSVDGFPLNVGDVITASVEYSGNSIYTLRLYNDTKKVVTTIPTQYTQSSTVQNMSAEWIVEAPYLNGVLPLADFNTLYMWGCIANINGVLIPLNNGYWQNTALEMVTDNGAPKAIPSTVLLDNGSFFVNWKHQ